MENQGNFHKLELRVQSLEQSNLRIEKQVNKLDTDIKEIYELIKNQIKIETKIEYLIKEIEKSNSKLDNKATHDVEISYLKESIKEFKDDRNKAKFAFLGTFLTLVSSIFYSVFIK